MSIPLPDLGDFEKEIRTDSQLISSSMMSYGRVRHMRELCDTLVDLNEPPTNEVKAEIYNELVELTKPGSSFSLFAFLETPVLQQCFSDIKRSDPLIQKLSLEHEQGK